MNDAITVTKEVIDKCYNFIVGVKSKDYPRNIKNGEFPDNLLSGTPQQRLILDLMDTGKSLRQIGAELDLSGATVFYHHRIYLAGLDFRNEWLSFWEFIAPLRARAISDIFYEWKEPGERSNAEKQTVGRFLGNCKRRNIETVGDLLYLYSHNTLREAKAVVSMYHKDFLFGVILNNIYSLLTVSKEGDS